MSRRNMLAKMSARAVNGVLGGVAAAAISFSPLVTLLRPVIASAATPGAIIVTEFMPNPSAVSDNNGEWIEVMNTTGSDIDLLGWDMSTGSSGSLGPWYDIDQSVTVPAGGYALLCKDSNPATNGGLTSCAYDYSNSHDLLNSAPGDVIGLRDTADIIITQVSYSNTDVIAGHSLINNSGSVAPENTSQYGDGDYGTPFGTAVWDTTPPVFDHVRPNAGQYIRRHYETRAYVGDPESGITGVTVEATGPSSSGVQAMAFNPVRGRWAYILDTAILTEGTYRFDFVATNGQGLSETTTVNNVIVDNTNPLSELTAPGSGDTLSGTVDIRGSLNDDNATATYRVLIRDFNNPSNIVSSTPPTDVPGNFTDESLFMWDTTTVPNGQYIILLRGRDRAGNRAPTTTLNRILITVDNDTVPPSFTALRPTDDSFLRRRGRMLATASDNVALASVEVRMQNGSFDTGFLPMNQHPSVQDRYRLNVPNDVPGGMYDVTFRATDTSGNTAEVTSTNVTYDDVRPTTIVSSPLDGAFVHGVVDITGTVSDTFLARVRTRVYNHTTPQNWHNSNLLSVSNIWVSPTSYSGVFSSWDTTTLPDGMYDLRIHAFDIAGNSGSANVMSITVDNTPPTVDAGSDATVSAPYTQLGSATDTNGIASIIWTQISGPGTVTFSDTGSLTPTVSADTDGTYVLELLVTDSAGNLATDTYTLVRTTPSPGPGPGSAPAGGPVGNTGTGGGAGPAGAFGAGGAGGNVLGANTDANGDGQNIHKTNASSTSTSYGNNGQVKAATDKKKSWLSYWYFWLPALLLLLLLITVLLAHRGDDDEEQHLPKA